MHYKDIEKAIKEIMPPECEVTRVEPEGLNVVVYIKNIRAFYEGDQLIKKLASAVRKKVLVRADKSVLLRPD